MILAQGGGWGKWMSRETKARMVQMDTGFLWDGSWVTSDVVRILGQSPGWREWWGEQWG